MDDDDGRRTLSWRRLATASLLIPMLRSGLHKQGEAAAAVVCDGGVCERGGERGDDQQDGGMRMRNAKCECADWRVIGGLRGGVWWGWRVRKRQAECERGDANAGMQSQAGCKARGACRCEGGHDGKRWKRARTLKPPLLEIGNFGVPPVLRKVFFFPGKKLRKKRKFLKVSKSF
jgi:hypothetical protein